MGKKEMKVSGVVGEALSHYYPLIPIAVPNGMAGGFLFPNGKGSFGVTQNFLENPALLEHTRPMAWGDAYAMVLANWRKNRRYLDPNFSGTKPKNAKALFGAIRNPDRVAVIASCGPSLSRNISYLYEARRQGLPVDVFCINRSTKAIRPDGFMVIERRPDDEWVEDRFGLPGYMICMQNTASEIVDHYIEREVPVYWGRSCIPSDVEAEDSRASVFPQLSVSGGTTISCLLYVLARMGYRKIALTGCDMAVEAGDVITNEEGRKVISAKRMYFDRRYRDTNYSKRVGWEYSRLHPVIAPNGETVLIHPDFVQYAGYIQAISAMLESYSGIEVCNCSEGGFLWLPRQMPLREYLCMEEIDEQRQIYNAVWMIDHYSDTSPGEDRGGHIYAMIENYETKHVLDYGCGAGHLSLGIAKRMPHVDVLGVDVSDVAIALGRAAAERGQFGNVKFKLLCDRNWGKNIPEGGMVACFDVLEHLASVKEVKSLFKKFAKRKPRVITGTACSGAAAFDNPYSDKNLHTLDLRPMEWQNLIESIGRKLGASDTLFDANGRLVAFTMVFGAVPK